MTIKTKTSRAKLEAKKDAHWEQIGGLRSGKHIGFYKPTIGPGSWRAKWNDPVKGRKYTVIGSEADMEYPQAEETARAWFDTCQRVAKPGTVTEACKAYIANLRTEKGDVAADSAEGFLERTVYDTDLGRTLMSDVRTGDVQEWRDQLKAGKRKPRTVNRILRSFKAALNYGYRQEMCDSSGAWDRVKALKGDTAPEARREPVEISKLKVLVAVCDGDKDPDLKLSKADLYDLTEWATPELGNLLRGLLYTAARPNELASATVKAFAPEQRNLTLGSAKGKGEMNARAVPLPPQAVEFFKAMAKDKLPTAPLLSIHGHPWLRHMWSRGIRAAVKVANLKAKKPADRLPNDVVAYTIRHCAISNMLKAGIDVGTVAKMAGTSIGMISTYYFKYIQTDVADKLERIQYI